MAYPVAVVQCDVEPGEVEQNRNNITRLCGEAIAQGARLVLLPEACVSDIYRGAEKLAETIPGPSTDVIVRIAGEATVALPLLERAADGKVYSACAFVSANGIRGVARKTHMYRDNTGHNSFRDEEVVSPGNELALLDLGDVRVGVLIGFDAEFPEAFRTLALRGADVVLVAQNSLEPDLAFLRAMALRNRLPLAVANRVGFRKVYPAIPEFSASALSILQDKDGAFLSRCKGGSAIIDGDGRAVAQPRAHMPPPEQPAPFGAQPIAHFQEDEILTASFRVEDLRVQRLTSPFISERRAELYEKK